VPSTSVNLPWPSSEEDIWLYFPSPRRQPDKGVRLKIILREDIKKLGKCGEVVEVKDGYANNYLMPRNLAIPATKGNLKAIEAVIRQKNQRDSKSRRKDERLKSEIEKISVTAEVSVGEEDKVFGSVTTNNIADLLKAKGFEFDRHKIELKEPLKALGVYTIPIKISSEVEANLKLWVVKKEKS
jgi:large subunit ribosomal protein L9